MKVAHIVGANYAATGDEYRGVDEITSINGALLLTMKPGQPNGLFLHLAAPGRWDAVDVYEEGE